MTSTRTAQDRPFLRRVLPILMGFVLLSSALFWAFRDTEPTLDKGTFGPFVRALNTTPHGYQILPDPTGAAPVKYIERFEVRDGECGRNGAWDECEQDRERSELSQTARNTGDGDTVWYGWSFYLPADWPNIAPTKTVIAQFHQTGLNGTNGHPVWMFLHNDGALVLDDQTSGRTIRFVPLISAQELLGRWHTIEIKSYWKKDASGTFDVWINGKHTFTHTGATMNAHKVYFRYGVYRSFVSRYKSVHRKKSVPTQTAFFANVKRANTREGLR